MSESEPPLWTPFIAEVSLGPTVCSMPIFSWLSLTWGQGLLAVLFAWIDRPWQKNDWLRRKFCEQAGYRRGMTSARWDLFPRDMEKLQGPGDTCTSSIAQGQGAKSEAEPCPTSGWNQAPTWMCGSPSTLVIVFGGTMGQCGWDFYCLVGDDKGVLATHSSCL